jgi:uncharacterized membrane protein
MSETAEQKERSRDFDRLLTFVDAIVAIAVTLLVLPLADAVGQLDKDDGSVSRLLRDNHELIGAFFLSFVVITNLWLTQHRVLRHVIASNQRLTSLLMIWTLTIVFLPFPTALVAGPEDAGGQAVTKVLYVGTMAVSSLVLGLVCVVVTRVPGLRDSEQSPDSLRAFGTGAAFLAALGVMLLVPAASYWPLLLLVVSDRVVDLVRPRSHLGRKPQQLDEPGVR